MRDRSRRVNTRLREWIFPLRVRRVSGPVRIETEEDNLIVVCVVRDGAAHLHEFHRHYRSLGAGHIVFLDNGSKDDTVRDASALERVTVLQTRAPYREHKVIMKRYLTRRFGRTAWVLCVDIDEFFDFPYRYGDGLPRMLRYLRRNGYTAAVAHMLDLFPAGPLLQSAGSDVLTQHHCFYDLSALRRIPYEQDRMQNGSVANAGLVVYEGGVRRTSFGVNVCLTKHPLLYSRGRAFLLSSHHVRGARIADFSCVLLHYKFAGDFKSYVRRVVEEESFYRASAEYKQYLRTLESDQAITLFSAHSRRLEDVDQLVQEGFLQVSEAYRAWMGAHSSDREEARDEPASYGLTQAI